MMKLKEVTISAGKVNSLSTSIFWSRHECQKSLDEFASLYIKSNSKPFGSIFFVGEPPRIKIIGINEATHFIDSTIIKDDEIFVDIVINPHLTGRLLNTFIKNDKVFLKPLGIGTYVDNKENKKELIDFHIKTFSFFERN